MGRYAEARSLNQKALGIRLKMLGECHPHTAISYNNLAEDLNATGEAVGAQKG
ncbi:tetratricopeptide repeat protein [Fimbriiglobus ruber]|uniref:Kinesin light chain n=1 Tax=Fimbriiglobus ruber TaxID=1908690 RepID=A0A225D7A3_9BACT|nr:hypothetical protein FRUB_06452 [Fimbriiglobus ruber]